MQLVSPKTFVEERWREGEITAATIRNRINRGLIKGGFKDEAGSYWIDLDVYFGRNTDTTDLEEYALSECDEITRQALAL